MTESIGARGKRYTMGGDDEVVMHTPYDEEEGVAFSALGAS